jgi:hypothetical protein
MGSRTIATEHRYPADFWSFGDTSPSRSEREPAFCLSSGEALILVLLLSFGLWAAIWGTVALLAVGGWW